ncbi:uncharacterized protein LOC121379450 [Gigantopelta aegis]|uniref:uncharacterized protein LOC121379450 n=1 Tax=Gigantopelta aegis TaxID=1735272 RepID=UPI001B88C104|nr:uncharacterized protein LOC121379450 [Gigantopelta aegis]
MTMVLPGPSRGIDRSRRQLRSKRARAMMDRRHWVTLAWFIILLATLVLLGGYAAPMWLWLQSSDGIHYFGVGLWYYVGCSDASCITTTKVKVDTKTDIIYDATGFQAIRGLETVGVVGCCLLLVCGMTYRIGFNNWTHMKTLNTALVIMTVLTELVILAGVIVFGVMYWSWIINSTLVSSRSFPWSPLLCLIAFFILLVPLFLLRTKAREYHYIHGAIPMSGDAKLDLNPQMKTAMSQRYFTPSPYAEDRRTTIDQSAYYDDVFDKPAYTISNFENKTYTRNQVDSTPLVSNVVYGVENRAYTTTDEFRRRSYSGPGNGYAYQMSNRMDISTETEVLRPRPKSIAADTTYTGHDVSYFREPIKQEPIHYEERVVTRVERVPVYGPAPTPVMPNQDIGTKYLGYGRVQALSDYEDPRLSQFERYTVHTRQRPACSTTRMITDARSSVDPTLGDGFANGSPYMYRPYQPQKY